MNAGDTMVSKNVVTFDEMMVEVRKYIKKEENRSDHKSISVCGEKSYGAVPQKRGAVYYSCDTGRLHTDDASYRTKDDCGRLSA